MTHSPTRIAAAALLGASATALVAVPAPAEAAAPAKNSTYKGNVVDTDYDIRVKVTIKVGSNTGKVKKVVAKLSCAEGKQKLVYKNIEVTQSGYFSKYLPDYANPTNAVSAYFVTKSKVDDGMVYGLAERPCGGKPLDFSATKK